MADVISTYAGLLDALRSLPPPADGRIRVFRGQNQEYPTMTPTALRAAPVEDWIWPLYARSLSTAGSLTDLLADLADDSKVTAIRSTDFSTYRDALLLWVRAIKQHYGPGTEFLDVTHSVGIAAWFALHSLQPVQVRANFAPPGDPWAKGVGGPTFMRHTLFKGPAVLYAMDAIRGNSAKDLVHGSLFDLALAPHQFSSSARIRAQQACLVYANRSVDGGDLASFIVPGTPLRIAWPLDGCPEVRKPTNQVFPAPREDDWYARFVAIPLAPNLDASRTETVLDHPINVTLYIPQGGSEAEDSAHLQDLIDRFRIPSPPLLYPKLADLNLPAWRGLADATPLYLEGPMMSTRVPLTETNIAMLASGLTRTAPVADYVTGEPSGDVSLENVFIEISALDEPYWEAFNRERPAISIIRGFWLVRDGDRFKLTTFMHDIATDEQIMLGPNEVVFDRKTGSYSARGAVQGAPWRPLRHPGAAWPGQQLRHGARPGAQPVPGLETRRVAAFLRDARSGRQEQDEFGCARVGARRDSVAAKPRRTHQLVLRAQAVGNRRAVLRRGQLGLSCPRRGSAVRWPAIREDAHQRNFQALRFDAESARRHGAVAAEQACDALPPLRIELL